MTEQIPFWLVWRDGGDTPTHKHDNVDQAKREADRLARANPGTTFFIVAPVESVERAELTRRTFVDLDGQIPF